jgi:hypothetical protein
MVKKEVAAEIQQYAIKAITELTTLLSVANEVCTNEELEPIKRAVGLAIGKIQMELLEPIYKDHPELDDLAT